MPEIFINYRTGDGEKTAALLDEALSHRFGDEAVFRAAKSIRPGKHFPDSLLAGVRRCGVLLAVVGPDWLDAPHRKSPGTMALDDEEDWVRREIAEAFRCGIPVVPVLDGRRTERLAPGRLPAPLQRLAELQSLRLDLAQKDTDLVRIGDALAELVPELAELDASPAGLEPPASSGSAHNSMGSPQGMGIQARDIGGDVAGTVIREPTGPVHTGSGNLYHHSQHSEGDGAVFVQGDYTANNYDDSRDRRRNRGEESR